MIQSTTSKRPALTVIQLIILVVIAGIVLSALFGGCGAITGKIEYSDGYREGNLQKLSKKGFIWKTYEGELTLWGFGGSQGGKMGQESMSNVWAFSLDDPSSAETATFADQINKHSLRAEKLRMHYTEYFSAQPWRGSSSYIVNKVIVINRDGSQVVLEPGKEPVNLAVTQEK